MINSNNFLAAKGLVDASNPVLKKNLQLNWRAFEERYQTIMAGKPIRFLTRAENKDGQTAWMQVSGECMDWMGGLPVYLLIYIDVTDLTDLREMHKRLEEQAEQLKAALEAAESANRAKSDFLSRMSLDIRTPMNAIIGMTEIASAHLDNPEKVKSCLKKILSSSQHLLGLINDVLDMSKIKSGKVVLHSDTMSLPETL